MRSILAFAICSLAAAPLEAAEENTPNDEGARDRPARSASDQIVVTASRFAQRLSEAPAAVTVVTAEDIENRNVSRVTDALLKVPSLFLGRGENGQSASFEGGFSLRGMSRQRTLALIDGLTPLQNGNSQGVNWLTVFPDDLERVEVVPGAFGALYGSNAIGGVINMITKRADKRELIVRYRQGFGDAAGEWPSIYYRDKVTDRLGVVIGGSANFRRGFVSEFTVRTPVAGQPGPPVTGAIPTTTREGAPALIVGDRGRVPWRQFNGVARLEYELADGHELRAGFEYAYARTNFTPFNTLLRDEDGQPFFEGPFGFEGRRFTVFESNFVGAAPIVEANRRYSAGYRGQFGAGELRVELSRIDRDFSFPAIGAGATAQSGPGRLTDVPNTSDDIIATYTTPIGDQHQFLIGASWHEDRVDRVVENLTNWRDRRTRTGEVLNGYLGKTNFLSAFVQDTWTPIENLSLYGGVRIDHWRTNGRFFQNTAPLANIDYPTRSETSVNPKVSAVWLPVETLSLRASWGRAFRAPSNLDLYSTTVNPSGVSPTGILTVESDPNITPERGSSWEIGTDWQPDPAVRVFANYYQIRLSDFIATQQVDLTLTRRLNAGLARVRGVEVGTTVTPTSWLSLDGNISYIDSQILDNPAAPATVGKRLTQVPEWLAYVGVTATPGDFIGTVEARYSGQTFVTALNTDTVQGVPSANDSFWMVNGQFGYKFTQNFRANLAINNILDRRIFQFGLLAGRTAMIDLVLIL
jgi:iron complex outermembrane recepter protein